MITENERKYLISSMEELLDEYGYRYTRAALDKIIDEWVEKKGWLIEAFKKHPSYLEGKFMIAFSQSYERHISNDEARRFSRWLRTDVIPFMEYTLPEFQIETQQCYGIPLMLNEILTHLQYHADRVITDEFAKDLEMCIPQIHPHAGEKTSRVINRICNYLGYSKHPEYNRRYAKYADSLSPLKIKRHTVLSLNPLDYLTMSFGNSWASCHTIDKCNKRDMPDNYEGCYSSGTISYMLDEASMVLYTIDESYNGDEFWSEPKINRQMFHYGQDKLVQGRLYPQSCDGYSDEYTQYRNTVQEIIARIFDIPNLWVVKHGTENASRWIDSDGTHYRDYANYESCTLSVLKDSTNVEYITVGAEPICIECGHRHRDKECINCCSYPSGFCCADCGCELDREDMIEIDGEYYCRDCCSYCDYCEEFHRGESTYIHRENIYVCEDCLERHYTQCDECGEFESDDYITHVSGGVSVCERCLEDLYVECVNCGEMVRHDEAKEYEDEMYCESCYEEIKEEEEDEAC